MKKFLLLVLSSALFLSACGAPEGISVKIDVPAQVKVDESFDLVVNIMNESDESQELNSIDIGHDYLKGVLLESSDPNYTESWDFDLLGFMSYDYVTELAAGETLQVTYTMKAISAGDYSDSLDVCFNTVSDCLYNTIRTIVEVE